jgi:hypothetical protein|tara:strand:+ start:6935 stop:7171 length:237 start_codon:yes stop_codon:yes gene_type:complete
MGYSKDNLDELMASKSLATKQKISEFLRIDCKMYANLGTDSTNKEIKEVKAISKRIYKHIQVLDLTMGTNFLNAIDSK